MRTKIKFREVSVVEGTITVRRKDGLMTFFHGPTVGKSASEFKTEVSVAFRKAMADNQVGHTTVYLLGRDLRRHGFTFAQYPEPTALVLNLAGAGFNELWGVTHDMNDWFVLHNVSRKVMHIGPIRSKGWIDYKARAIERAAQLNKEFRDEFSLA